MNLDEHIKQLIGDLVFTIAKLRADTDAAREAALESKTSPPKPEMPDTTQGAQP